jgi:hypothetical protein
MKSLVRFLFVLSTFSFPFASSEVFADGPPSLFEQSLQNAATTTIDTKESIVEHNGIKYRKVESSMGIYYFRFLGRDEDVSELQCETDFNRTAPPLAMASVEVYHRARVFIRTLKETCESHNGQKKMDVNWRDLEVGVALPDSKNSVIKDKEIYVNPLKGPNAGFSGTF